MSNGQEESQVVGAQVAALKKGRNGWKATARQQQDEMEQPRQQLEEIGRSLR